MSAATAIDAALLSLAHREQTPPCADGSNAWTSDDHEIRTLAIPLCAGCDLLTLCAQYATEIKATFGVWAGQDRTPTNKKANT